MLWSGSGCSARHVRRCDDRSTEGSGTCPTSIACPHSRFLNEEEQERVRALTIIKLVKTVYLAILHIHKLQVYWLQMNSPSPFHSCTHVTISLFDSPRSQVKNQGCTPACTVRTFRESSQIEVHVSHHPVAILALLCHHHHATRVFPECGVAVLAVSERDKEAGGLGLEGKG